MTGVAALPGPPWVWQGKMMTPLRQVLALPICKVASSMKSLADDFCCFIGDVGRG